MEREGEKGEGDLMLPRIVMAIRIQSAGATCTCAKGAWGGCAGLSDDRAWWWLERWEKQTTKMLTS